MSEADYNRLTIAQLKEELESRALDKTGRKADLVSRLVEHDKASGTEAVVEEEANEEETAVEESAEQAEEDMVTLDQVGDGDDAAQPDEAAEEALLKDDEPPADGAAAEGGDAAADAPADTSATEAKDADMKDMVVIDEFDALGDEIEVEMARLIDEQIEAARERTKLEEAEKEKKAKEEAEKKAAKEAEEKAKKEAEVNGDGEKKEGEEDEGKERKEGEEDKPEEEKTEEEKKAEKEKKEKEEKEKKEKEKKKVHVQRMSYAKPPKMSDVKLELACDMVKHTVQIQPLSLEQLNHEAIKPFLDQAATYRFMRGWNSERGLTGRLQLIFFDPSTIDEVIKAVEENQEALGEQCKARSFGGIKTVDIRHTFMRQVVPCTDADIGQLSLLLRRMPVTVTPEKLRAVFPDSTYIMLNKEERYAMVLYHDKEKYDAVLEKAEELEIDDCKVDCSQYQPFKKPKPEKKEEEEETTGDDIRKNAIKNLYKKYCDMEQEGSDMSGLQAKITALKKMLEADDALKKKDKKDVKKGKEKRQSLDRKPQNRRGGGPGGYGRGGGRGGNYGGQGMKRRRNDNYGPSPKQGRFDDRGGRFYGGGGGGYSMGGGGYDQGYGGGYGGGGGGYGGRMGGGYGGGGYGNQGGMGGGGGGGGQGNALNFIVGLSQALNNMKQGGGRSGGYGSGGGYGAGGGGYGGGGYGGGGYGGGGYGGGRQFGGRNRRN